MARSAAQFLRGHSWCVDIRRGSLDIGWEGIVAVFLFEIDPAQAEIDSSMWVIVGDLPAAYICNDNPNGASALNAYVKGMQRWIDAVRVGGDVSELMPMNTAPTREHADQLQSRLDFIRNELLPSHESDIVDCD